MCDLAKAGRYLVELMEHLNGRTGGCHRAFQVVWDAIPSSTSNKRPQAPDSSTNSYPVAAQPPTGSSLGFVSPLKMTAVTD